MGAEATQEVLAVCQPEEMSISSEKGSVLWLYGIFKRHLHGKEKNRGCQVVA